MTGKRAAKVAISLVYWCARSVFGAGGGRFVILYYHGVPGVHREGFARQLDAAARYGRVVPADFAGPVGKRERLVAITFDDAFVSVGEQAVPELVKRGMPAMIFAPADVLGQEASWEMSERARASRERIMTAEELRGLPDLISIGCHSGTHARLPALDDVELRDEVRGSRERLSAVLGRDVKTFSFPYGAHDDRVVKECRRAGYGLVYSVEPRKAGEMGEFVRGRVAVEPDDWKLEYFLKIRGAYSWMVAASSVKRRVRAWLGEASPKRPAVTMGGQV